MLKIYFIQLSVIGRQIYKKIVISSTKANKLKKNKYQLQNILDNNTKQN